jgi:protein-tyrosine phosphatase
MALAFVEAFVIKGPVSQLEVQVLRSRCSQAPEASAFGPWHLNPKHSRRASLPSRVVQPPQMSVDERPARVLVVCLGNICRSPAAEAVLRAVVVRRGLESAIAVDSCGLGGTSPNWYKPGGFSYNEGKAADGRMREAAKKRGYDITSIARPLRVPDFAESDLIVGMDATNLEAIDTARRAWGVGNPGSDGVARVALFSTFSPNEQFRGRPVPDPYYGGMEGFEHVLDLIEDTCEGILSDPVISRKIEALKSG